MIGQRPKPFIFVHIPKCAGTSIERALIPIASDHKELQEFSEDERTTFWLPGAKLLQHSKLQRYEERFKLDDYVKFAFVRNPWDRAISQISHLRLCSQDGLRLLSRNTFKDNVKIYCSSTKTIVGHDLGACQLDYLQKLSGDVGVDFVGRFESLLDDFEKVCAMIGIEPIPDLQHYLNTNRAQHYSTFYDAESAGWIRERFAKDIDFFGYEFQNESQIESPAPSASQQPLALSSATGNSPDPAPPPLIQPATLSAADKSAAPWLKLTASRDFPAWLAAQHASLAVTTYQGGKLLMIGVDAKGRLTVVERTFTRCMGLWADPTEGRTLWLASLYQLWRLENSLLPGQKYKGHDRLYVPRLGITTGNLDVHDLALESSGRLVFVNTLCSCLATISPRLSFTPLWHPPFISKLMPEDRCHLNGLALENGRAAYVTTCSTSDVADGWRNSRNDGGTLIDVRTNQTLLAGLSMPHSPRVHDHNIYLHNSGTGQFGRADPAAHTFLPICFCPGYLRGLAFLDNCAIVGLSKPRDKAFTGLQLEAELAKRDAPPICGLQVIDLKSGQVAHSLKIEGLISELYEVVVLPTVSHPTLLGFKTSEIQQVLMMDEPQNL